MPEQPCGEAFLHNYAALRLRCKRAVHKLCPVLCRAKHYQPLPRARHGNVKHAHFLRRGPCRKGCRYGLVQKGFSLYLARYKPRAYAKLLFADQIVHALPHEARIKPTYYNIRKFKALACVYAHYAYNVCPARLRRAVNIGRGYLFHVA